MLAEPSEQRYLFKVVTASNQGVGLDRDRKRKFGLGQRLRKPPDESPPEYHPHDSLQTLPTNHLPNSAFTTACHYFSRIGASIDVNPPSFTNTVQCSGVCPKSYQEPSVCPTESLTFCLKLRIRG
jgi:hypothetical protein